MINVVIQLDGKNALQLSKGDRATIADLKQEVVARLGAYNRLKTDVEYCLRTLEGLYPDSDMELRRMLPSRGGRLVLELKECY